jgi:hypothetical protein
MDMNGPPKSQRSPEAMLQRLEKTDAELHRILSDVRKRSAWDDTFVDATHGPSRTASFIRSVLESHPYELRSTTVPIDRLEVLLHDSLTGDVLYRLLAGVGRHTQDTGLESLACNTVDVILGNVRKRSSVVD